MPLNRRQFVTQAGSLAAGVGLSAVARPTLGGPKSPVRSANETIACAMIGVGGRAQGLMQWALAHDAVVIAALCDVNEQNLGRSVKSVARIQGTEPVTVGDFQRLLEDPSIDAVMVATPHHWHCPIAVRALDAGKHVYLEKPASHVFQEGRRLVDAALRNNRIVQHGTQMRSSELTAAAAKVLSSGILGAIKMAKAWGVEPRSHHPNPVPDQSPPDWLNYPMWLGPAPQRPFNHNRFQRWNSYRDYGNGEIGGDGIHDIDLARWGLGVTTHPVRITAQGSRIHLKGESDYPDNMMVTYQYADDKVLIYENRNFAPYAMHGWDNGNMFCGTEGYMVFSRRGYFQTYLGSKEEPGPGQRGGAGNQEHVHNFFDGVRSGTQTNADAQVAHLSCALVHLGEIAYRTGRVLQFDPESETFPGNDEANAMLGKPYRTPWGFAES